MSCEVSTEFRTVEDTLGPINVPADRYYGAQTERSRRNFNICVKTDRMPIQVIYALARLKEVAAQVNCSHSRIKPEQADAIKKACREVYNGKLDKEFPLVVWQTGSGTQTNMNVNEVIAARASEILDGKRNEKLSVHPNDHVNHGQSSNDMFPTAMNVSVAIETSWNVLPSLEYLAKSLESKMSAFMNVVKIGRTHMQDAVPMTVGQELSAYVYQIRQSIEAIKRQLPFTCHLAVGGTAVGTGLNSVEGFAEEVCVGLTENIKVESATRSEALKHDVEPLVFVSSENKFATLSGHDSLLQLSGCFNTAATALMHLANDFCLLSSGPSCGFGEYMLPANEPGSSIMPGKVNPTQCESLRMVSVQIMGNHFTVTMAASKSELELNVYKPLIVRNLIHTCDLLSGAAMSFANNCVNGLELNRERIDQYVSKSLMLVTALNPRIGYDSSAKIAKYAQAKRVTLREAAVALNLLTAEEFDEIVKPEEMAFPHKRETK